MASNGHSVANNLKSSKESSNRKLSLVQSTNSNNITNVNDRDHMALVLKNEEIANVFAMNNINLRQKIPLKHQFFTLSLIEYICNMLNLNSSIY